jgi:periplasmic divalent cation tolerance protein
MTDPSDKVCPALIWCPFPDPGAAKAIAKSLLDEGHVACANIIPEMISLFVWKGERGEDMEAAVLFKTNSALLDDAIARLTALHPYEEPAILAWYCDAAAPVTAAWLDGLGQ